MRLILLRERGRLEAASPARPDVEILGWAPEHADLRGRCPTETVVVLVTHGGIEQKLLEKRQTQLAIAVAVGVLALVNEHAC